MLFAIGDKLILANIECRVALVNAYGGAYLKPEHPEDVYNEKLTQLGVIFAVVDERGKDKFGNIAIPINNAKCGAV